MVWIDIVCCVIIAIFALLGLWHGLLKSIFKLIAWVAGLLGAYFATDVIGNFIANFFNYFHNMPQKNKRTY